MIKYKVVLESTISVLKIQKIKSRRVWVYKMGIRIIQQAPKAGVLICAGSDSDQKTFVQHEMKILVNECNFTPLEGIIAATKYSAMATGILPLMLILL